MVSMLLGPCRTRFRGNSHSRKTFACVLKQNGRPISSANRIIAKYLLFRDPHLRRLSSLVSDLEPHQQQWVESIHPDIKPDAGKVQVLASRHMACQFGQGGSRLLGQFPTGFPSAGVLSQKGAFSESPSPAHPSEHRLISKTTISRFRERAAKYGTENSSRIWSEAIEEVEKGRLCHPAELGSAGLPADFRPGCFNISFRFGV